MTDLSQDMLKWRGRKWLGPDAHFCYDWDGLPVDAFTPEYQCCSSHASLIGKFFNFFYMKYWNYRMNRTYREKAD